MASAHPDIGEHIRAAIAGVRSSPSILRMRDGL